MVKVILPEGEFIMKTRKIIAALCASTMVLSAMAAQVSAEGSTGTENAGTSAETSENASVFKKGVWKFTSDKGDVIYYIFNDEKSGHTETEDGLGGVAFACEQDGWNITFHFGGVDDTTKAVVSEGDASITLTYEDGKTLTYSVEYVDGADPDTFSVDEDMNPTTVFRKGVWLLTAEDSIDTYYIFTDEKSGYTARADGTGGVPFACEQDGWNITFHFGGVDDTTKAVVSSGDASITFTYEDGETKTYSVKYIDGADPDTFDVDSLGLVPEDLYDLDGMGTLFTPGVWKFTVYPVEDYIVTEPEGYVQIDADGTGYMMNAHGLDTAISFDYSDLENIKIIFEDTGMEGIVQLNHFEEGVVETYLSADGNTMLYTFNYVPDDEADEFIENFKASLDENAFVEDGAVDAADDEKTNPATGVNDLVLPLSGALLFGAAALISRKRK